MTKIDFYILQDSTADARWHFACRLVDKALRSGHRVLITANSQDEVRQLDDLLWTFKPETFIAHDIFDQHSASEAMSSTPVAIATTALPDHQLHEHRGLLVNLGHEIPRWFSRFERMSEIVIQEPEILKNTREHFSFFRERGYPIEYRHI